MPCLNYPQFTSRHFFATHYVRSRMAVQRCCIIHNYVVTDMIIGKPVFRLKFAL